MSQPCSAVESQDLLSLLRAGTRRQHLALEQHPLLHRLLAPDLVRHEYGMVLQAFWCFYQSLEPGLMAVLPELERQVPFGVYSYQPRLPLLEADFSDLLLAKPAPGVASNATIRYPTPVEALGILYVLEGATQGGRVIAARLQQSLGSRKPRVPTTSTNTNRRRAAGRRFAVGWAAIAGWHTAMPLLGALGRLLPEWPTN